VHVDSPVNLGKVGKWRNENEREGKTIRREVS
jgi:hypothetical protein